MPTILTTEPSRLDKLRKGRRDRTITRNQKQIAKPLPFLSRPVREGERTKRILQDDAEERRKLVERNKRNGSSSISAVFRGTAAFFKSIGEDIQDALTSAGQGARSVLGLKQKQFAEVFKDQANGAQVQPAPAGLKELTKIAWAIAVIALVWFGLKLLKVF